MKPTIAFLQERFEHFNDLIFGGALPPIPIVLTNAKGFMAKFVFRKTKQHTKIVETHCELRFNTRLELEENVLEDILIHEMIHYFIHYQRVSDNAPHGRLFRKMMQDINVRFGRHITVSYKLSEQERSVMIPSRRKKSVLCLINLTDGQAFIKVVPRQQAHINYMNAALPRAFNIKTMRWFLSNDIFFSRFPSSTAMRIQKIDEKEVEKHLLSAVALRCENNKIRFVE